MDLNELCQAYAPFALEPRPGCNPDVRVKALIGNVWIVILYPMFRPVAPHFRMSTLHLGFQAIYFGCYAVCFDLQPPISHCYCVCIVNLLSRF